MDNLDSIRKKSACELVDMVKKARGGKSDMLRAVELLLLSSRETGVTVFPNSSYDRKLIYLLCSCLGAHAEKLDEKPFHQSLYSPNCVIGCGCDVVHLDLFPLFLTLDREPLAKLSDLVRFKDGKKAKVGHPPCPPPPEDSRWSSLPAPALLLVLSKLSVRMGALFPWFWFCSFFVFDSGTLLACLCRLESSGGLGHSVEAPVRADC